MISARAAVEPSTRGVTARTSFVAFVATVAGEDAEDDADVAEPLGPVGPSPAFCPSWVLWS